MLHALSHWTLSAVLEQIDLHGGGTQRRKQQVLRGQRNQRVERGFMTVGFIASQTDECVKVVGGEGNSHERSD